MSHIGRKMNRTGFGWAAFIRERDEAMLSLDEVKIRAYARKYKLDVPDDPIAFWGGIHKARCAWTKCPPEARAESVAWLRAHGMSEGVPQ